MVAFLQKLPELTPAQYQILTARSAAEPLEDAAPAESSAAGAPEESSHEGHTH